MNHAEGLTGGFHKTLTNLMFIWLGFKGIRDCLKYSHPTIFVIAFVGYMVVGVGSTFFHASLKCKPADLSFSADFVSTHLVQTPCSWWTNSP